MKIKSHIFIVLLILFILSLIIFKLHEESKSHVFIFNRMTSINNILSKKLIDNFFSDDIHLKATSTEAIKKIVLQDIGYDNWLDYIEFIELYLYPVDIVYDNSEDLIIWINLSKDQGAVGVYRLHEDKYILHNKIENLAYIKNVSSIRINTLDKSFIIIEEVLDEIIGAFFIDNYIRIFSQSNNKFIEVFRQSTDYTAYFFERWNAPETAEPKWYKIAENAVVDNIIAEKNYIGISISKSIFKYEALNSSTPDFPQDFKLITQAHFDTKLIWNEQYESFIMAEGKILSENIDVGILEDTTQTVDYLLNLTGKYYKVIDKNKKIMYFDKENILLIKNFSTL